ncbi:PorV/PorQ family protein [bacterium]|nr:MAG: PorV/PorQ family protein [bacterium]
MTRSVHVRFALIAVMVAASLAWAGDRSGIVSGNFLKIPVNARIVGMGGTSVALIDNASSLAYNPSGMVYVKQAEPTSPYQYGLAASYTQWVADIKHSFFGAVLNLDGVGAVGLGTVILTTDDMAVTTPAFPDGTGEHFKASDYAFILALARQISDKFSVGISVKYIRSYLFNTEYGASCFAFDAGTIYEIPALRSRLGMSVSNLGSDMKFINEAYSLPTALRFGVLTDIIDEPAHALKGVFQITRPNDSNEQYNLGAEYTFARNFTLRGGYKFGYDAENWTGGFGLNFDLSGVQAKLDYGYNNFKWLPGTHSISMEVGM